MLKTTRLPDVSKPEVENGDNEVVGFGVGGDEKLAKKSGKSKGKKSKKSFKSQNSTKSGKNLSKSGIHLISALRRPNQAF